MDWFRWHHGTVTDRKWPRIASRAGTTVANVIAVWAALLEFASQAELRGYAFLSDDDSEDLDTALGMPPDTTRKVIAELCARGMIDDENRLAAWDKRQPKREREDNSAERVRKFRERRESDAVSKKRHDATESAELAAATPSNASVTEETPRGEEIRGEEKREEKEQKSPSPKGSRLPSDWEPSQELVDWARQERPDVDLRKEAATFRDYWAAKAGKDGVKLDWSATWRNWIRKANGPPRGSARPQPSSPMPTLRLT